MSVPDDVPGRSRDTSPVEGGSATRSMAKSGRVRKASITTSADTSHLSRIPLAPKMATAARRIIQETLTLSAGELLVLVVDPEHEQMGASVLHEARDMGIAVKAFVVASEVADSPLFQDQLADELEAAHGSALICGHGLPVEFRRSMIDGGGKARRHAHLVGVTEAMLSQSMRADLSELHALGERLARRMEVDTVLEVCAGFDTTLYIEVDPTCRWVNASGLLPEPGWVNLPGGELFTAPGNVYGTAVADGGVWLPDGRVLGRDRHLTLEFASGRIVRALGADGRELEAALAELDGGTRVGQVAFGTNTSILAPIGDLAQDLKLPGFHLVLGDPCPEMTGAGFSSTVEVPILMRRPDVRVDGTPVMVRGRYARDLF